MRRWPYPHFLGLPTVLCGEWTQAQWRTLGHNLVLNRGSPGLSGTGDRTHIFCGFHLRCLVNTPRRWYDSCNSSYRFTCVIWWIQPDTDTTPFNSSYSSHIRPHSIAHAGSPALRGEHTQAQMRPHSIAHTGSPALSGNTPRRKYDPIQWLIHVHLRYVVNRPRHRYDPIQ